MANKIKYVVTGSNFSTECCREPEEWGGFPAIDTTLVKDIYKKFGNNKLKTFPLVEAIMIDHSPQFHPLLPSSSLFSLQQRQDLSGYTPSTHAKRFPEILRLKQIMERPHYMLKK